MKMNTKNHFAILNLLLLFLLAVPTVAEEFSILFSATVQGETKPCG